MKKKFEQYYNLKKKQIPKLKKNKFKSFLNILVINMNSIKQKIFIFLLILIIFFFSIFIKSQI